MLKVFASAAIAVLILLALLAVLPNPGGFFMALLLAPIVVMPAWGRASSRPVAILYLVLAVVYFAKGDSTVAIVITVLAVAVFGLGMVQARRSGDERSAEPLPVP